MLLLCLFLDQLAEVVLEAYAHPLVYLAADAHRRRALDHFALRKDELLGKGCVDVARVLQLFLPPLLYLEGILFLRGQREEIAGCMLKIGFRINSQKLE